MNTFELKLCYSEQQQRPECAFLLSGSDPQLWLDEIGTWDCNSADVDLFPIPNSRGDLGLQGVLVVFADGAQIPMQILAPAYGRVGSRLLTPVDSTFLPVMTDSEWDDLLSSSERVSIWHPQLGLIGFEPDEVLSVADLIEFTLPGRSNWSSAQAGVGFNSRLLSIQAVWPENPGEMIREGSGGIGSKGGELKKLKRKRLGGNANGLAQKTAGMAAGAAVGLVLTPFAMAAKMITGMLPGTASQPTWVNKVEDWSNGILRKGANLFNSRMREMDRLMKMLNDSPDEGLKYAIPMGQGDGTPDSYQGSRLTGRNVDFSLRNLFGSGPADYWDMPYDVQAKLNARYRELAEREVHLGRHRRAAYIYAELLGDLNGAAAVLVAGKHFREAAVLYKEKLFRPREAAQCLEKGGLLHDAVEIYTELGNFEKVGNLHSSLEDQEAADNAYCREVEKYLATKNYVQAARILDDRLDNPSEAIIVLETGWSGTSHVKKCLQKSFEIQARLGQHDAVKTLIHQFSEESYQRSRAVAIVSALGTVAISYPDSSTQAQAADASRIIASKTAQADPKSARQLLGLVEKLAPEDRLLKRDTSRFLKQHHPTPVSRTLRQHSTNLIIAKLESMQKLGWADTAWRTFAQSNQHVYAVGDIHNGQLALGLGSYLDDGLIYLSASLWGGEISPRNNATGITRAKKSSLGLAHHDDQISIALDEKASYLAVWSSCFELGLIDAVPPDSTDAMKIGTPAFLTDETVNIASDSGILWAVEWPSLALKGFNRDGLPVINRQLEMPGDWEFDYKLGIPMLAQENAVYVALGATLLQITKSGRVLEIEFDHVIQRMAGSVSHTLSRIAVFFEEGGAVFWPRLAHEQHFENLPQGMYQPDGLFLRNGNFITHANGDWRLYSTESRKLKSLGSISGIAHKPTAILRHPDPNQIVICTEGGEVAVYSISK